MNSTAQEQFPSHASASHVYIASPDCRNSISSVSAADAVELQGIAALPTLI